MSNTGPVETENIRKKMIGFINDTFLKEDEPRELDGDESFLESGIVDSTGVLELVTFTEETFDIDVEDEEMVPENLDSLNNITSYIHRKLSAS